MDNVQGMDIMNIMDTINVMFSMTFSNFLEFLFIGIVFNIIGKFILIFSLGLGIKSLDEYDRTLLLDFLNKMKETIYNNVSTQKKVLYLLTSLFPFHDFIISLVFAISMYYYKSNYGWIGIVKSLSIIENIKLFPIVKCEISIKDDY